MPDLLVQFIKNCEKEYKAFMGIDAFPSYQIRKKELTVEKAQTQGFDSLAAAFYDIPTGGHTLEIWSKAFLPQMNSKYLVFHEFTHILDAETYSCRDKFKHMSSKGYTEYHAAQIDLLTLLGAHKAIQESGFSFSISQSFETFGGKKTADDFLKMPCVHASELISRDDFPANIEMLAITFGLIFNYYGRRSICKMYATDFQDTVDTSRFVDFLGIDTIKALDDYMLGWFAPSKVDLINQLYGHMIISIAQRNHLS